MIDRHYSVYSTSSDSFNNLAVTLATDANKIIDEYDYVLIPIMYPIGMGEEHEWRGQYIKLTRDMLIMLRDNIIQDPHYVYEEEVDA